MTGWATSEPGIPIKISNVIPYETKSYDHKSCFLVQQQALILGRWMVHIILINQIQKTTPYNHTNRIRIRHSFLIFSSFFSAELITFLTVYCSLLWLNMTQWTSCHNSRDMHKESCKNSIYSVLQQCPQQCKMGIEICWAVEEYAVHLSLQFQFITKPTAVTSTSFTSTSSYQISTPNSHRPTSSSSTHIQTPP